MKKFIFTLITAVSILSLTSCSNSTAMKSKNSNIEITVPDKNWSVVSDENGSFVLSKDNSMISCISTDLPSGYKIPSTEKDLLNTFGENISNISKISDFEYNEPDNTSKVLFYKQTIKENDINTTIIHKEKIKDNTLMIAEATLTNIDDNSINQIFETIYNLYQ